MSDVVRKFKVEIKTGRRWKTNTIFNDKLLAIEDAERLEKKPFDGVRVVEERTFRESGKVQRGIVYGEGFQAATAPQQRAKSSQARPGSASQAGPYQGGGAASSAQRGRAAAPGPAPDRRNARQESRVREPLTVFIERLMVRIVIIAAVGATVLIVGAIAIDLAGQ